MKPFIIFPFMIFGLIIGYVYYGIRIGIQWAHDSIVAIKPSNNNES
jgi:hypothetical protein